MNQVTIDADTLATLVALPVAVAHICQKLLEAADEQIKLADNLDAAIKDVIPAVFPDAADPLAAIHLDRNAEAQISSEIAKRMHELADGLQLVATMVDMEMFELKIGEEELSQTIAILRSPTAAPVHPVLHSVPTGPLTSA